MQQDIWMLAFTAGLIGALHSAISPDHYLPFIMMRRAQRWSNLKTMLVTSLCGIGHVAGSFVLGAVGIGLGLGASRMVELESVRGSLGAWLLIGFGLAYTSWGLRQAWKKRPHRHWHAHDEGLVHNHEHAHRGEHAHVHHKEGVVSVTPWILFVIFILGPCEALIPALMYPAFESSLWGVGIVAGIFAASTLITMVFMVFALDLGFEKLRLGRFERFGHALAGAALVLCGSIIAVAIS